MKYLAVYLNLTLLSSFLAGCGIGFDHTLFMTKSNIGIDIDTKPPTAEISIARRELVIAPAFEGGQTPSVLAGFNTGQRLLFGFDVSSVFAGGDAARTLSIAGKGDNHSDKLCLDTKPEGKPYIGPIPLGNYSLPSKGEIKPFVFGTDTTFGLKVAWSGMTAQFPDSFKIGFNRKELALAPVFGQENPTDTGCKYSVEMPAFLATIEVAKEGASPQSFESKYRQSFSTGKAANALAAKSDVKRFLLERLDISSEAAKIAVENEQKQLGKILEYISDANGVVNSSKLQALLDDAAKIEPNIAGNVSAEIKKSTSKSELAVLFGDTLSEMIEPLYKSLPSDKR